ncbi:MAG: tRNA pseudouridine(38-40) synthase TruA [Hungatella sp.]
MIKNYKMVLQYDGSRYDGWQKQGNTDNTIQDRIEKVLTKMVEKPVEVIGSGRTDAGVHAIGQVANAHFETEKTPEEIQEYLNRYLPDDIAVTNLEEAEDRFHSRLNATGKVYSYWIETAEKKPVFQRKYIYGLGEALDIEAMKCAAEKLCGTHDFKSFCSNKNSKKSTVRTLRAVNFQTHGTQIEIHFIGDGFLYNMVRILVGTLIEVGRGKRDPKTMGALLEAGERQAAGYTAPPEGLFLASVLYM